MSVTPAQIQQFETRQSLQKTLDDGSGIVVDGQKIAVARKTKLHTKLADHGFAVSEKVKSLLLQVVSQGGGLGST